MIGHGGKEWKCLNALAHWLAPRSELKRKGKRKRKHVDGVFAAGIWRERGEGEDEDEDGESGAGL